VRERDGNAIFNYDVIVCWSYPSGEIFFQKKLDKWMYEIEWNPFRPNVFATFGRVSCFFISNLFPRVRYTSCDLPQFLQNIRPKTAKSNMLTCLEPQHFVILSSSYIKLHMISRHFSKTIFVWPQYGSVQVIRHGAFFYPPPLDTARNEKLYPPNYYLHLHPLLLTHQMLNLILLFRMDLEKFSCSIPALSTKGHFVSTQSNMGIKFGVSSGSLRIESL